MIVTMRIVGIDLEPVLRWLRMGRKLLGGAGSMLGLATDVIKHVAWYVSHRIDPRPRERR
jgi:hypothetical protein